MIIDLTNGIKNSKYENNSYHTDSVTFLTNIKISILKKKGFSDIVLESEKESQFSMLNRKVSVLRYTPSMLQYLNAGYDLYSYIIKYDLKLGEDYIPKDKNHAKYLFDGTVVLRDIISYTLSYTDPFTNMKKSCREAMGILERLGTGGIRLPEWNRYFFYPRQDFMIREESYIFKEGTYECIPLTNKRRRYVW